MYTPFPLPADGGLSTQGNDPRSDLLTARAIEPPASSRPLGLKLKATSSVDKVGLAIATWKQRLHALLICQA